ncbi:MAG: Y4bD/Y4pK family protein [Acidobacteriia bacterium]|nr:Y4bD/Y4pK family protein [Terriglobia bacterium]
MTITRPHHPSQGQSLEVLRQARMPGGLQFVLILPDGSKSLVPAEWTDFRGAAGPPPSLQLLGSLGDLLRLRGLADALLHRSADLPLPSVRDQESHAATASELHRHPHPGDVPVGATRRRAKTDRHRSSGAPACPGDPRPTPGADQ